MSFQNFKSNHLTMGIPKNQVSWDTTNTKVEYSTSTSKCQISDDTFVDEFSFNMFSNNKLSTYHGLKIEFLNLGVFKNVIIPENTDHFLSFSERDDNDNTRYMITNYANKHQFEYVLSEYGNLICQLRVMSDYIPTSICTKLIENSDYNIEYEITSDKHGMYINISDTRHIIRPILETKDPYGTVIETIKNKPYAKQNWVGDKTITHGYLTNFELSKTLHVESNVFKEFTVYIVGFEILDCGSMLEVDFTNTPTTHKEILFNNAIFDQNNISNRHDIEYTIKPMNGVVKGVVPELILNEPTVYTSDATDIPVWFDETVSKSYLMCISIDHMHHKNIGLKTFLNDDKPKINIDGIEYTPYKTELYDDDFKCACYKYAIEFDAPAVDSTVICTLIYDHLRLNNQDELTQTDSNHSLIALDFNYLTQNNSASIIVETLTKNFNLEHIESEVIALKAFSTRIYAGSAEIHSWYCVDHINDVYNAINSSTPSLWVQQKTEYDLPTTNIFSVSAVPESTYKYIFIAIPAYWVSDINNLQIIDIDASEGFNDLGNSFTIGQGDWGGSDYYFLISSNTSIDEYNINIVIN